MWCFFLKIPRPPRYNRTDTLFPSTPLFRSRHRPGSDRRPGETAARHAAARVGIDRRRILRPLLSGARGMAVWDLSIFSNMNWEEAVSPGMRARSEEHTSELQSLMRISYAVFCFKKKKQHNTSRKVDSQ